MHNRLARHLGLADRVSPIRLGAAVWQGAVEGVRFNAGAKVSKVAGVQLRQGAGRENLDDEFESRVFSGELLNRRFDVHCGRSCLAWRQIKPRVGLYAQSSDLQGLAVLS